MKALPAAVIIFAVSTAAAVACDRPAAIERVSKIIAKGDFMVPEKTGDEFVVAVRADAWDRLLEANRNALALDLACTVSGSPVVFRDGDKVLAVFRDGRFSPSR